MSNTITAKVISTRPAGNSHYGNPLFDVTLGTLDGDTITMRTASDVLFADDCENPKFREKWHTYVLSPSGHIKYARKYIDW